MVPHKWEIAFSAKETKRAAFIWAVLVSGSEWTRHGSVTVGTKALIIHFPSWATPVLTAADGTRRRVKRIQMSNAGAETKLDAIQGGGGGGGAGAHVCFLCASVVTRNRSN